MSIRRRPRLNNRTLWLEHLMDIGRVRYDQRRLQLLKRAQRLHELVLTIYEAFSDLMPDEYRPSTSTSNAEELIFDKIDSGYLISVATNEGAGRSATVQCLHGADHHGRWGRPAIFSLTSCDLALRKAEGGGSQQPARASFL